MHSFPEFLTKKYLDWQATIGERKTLDEFAIYLGISRPLLSMWLNGTRRPGIKNIELLAELFGVDVYDALDLPRPDPFVVYVQGTSERLKDNQKKKIAEQIAKYIIRRADDGIHGTLAYYYPPAESPPSPKAHGPDDAVPTPRLPSGPPLYRHSIEISFFIEKQHPRL